MRPLDTDPCTPVLTRPLEVSAQALGSAFGVLGLSGQGGQRKGGSQRPLHSPGVPCTPRHAVHFKSPFIWTREDPGGSLVACLCPTVAPKVLQGQKLGSPLCSHGLGVQGFGGSRGHRLGNRADSPAISVPAHLAPRQKGPPKRRLESGPRQATVAGPAGQPAWLLAQRVLARMWGRLTSLPHRAVWKGTGQVTSRFYPQPWRQDVPGSRRPPNADPTVAPQVTPTTADTAQGSIPPHHPEQSSPPCDSHRVAPARGVALTHGSSSDPGTAQRHLESLFRVALPLSAALRTWPGEAPMGLQ